MNDPNTQSSSSTLSREDMSGGLTFDISGSRKLPKDA